MENMTNKWTPTTGNDAISRSKLREKVNAFYDEHFKGLVPMELIKYAQAVDDFIDNALPIDDEQGE